jgi:hypothetical protein
MIMAIVKLSQIDAEVNQIEKNQQLELQSLHVEEQELETILRYYERNMARAFSQNREVNK